MRLPRSLSIAGFALVLCCCGGGSAGSSAAGSAGSASPGAPGAPAVGHVVPRVEGATIYLNHPASNGGSVVTKFTATSNPDGITGTSDGNSTRIDMNGLRGGVSYTFTVTASNANGTGPASASSSPVTTVPYSDYYVFDGSGLNPQWADLYPFNVTNTWNSTDVPPLRGSMVLKVNIPSGNGTTQPFYKHDVSPIGAGGGRFNLYPYNYMTVAIWPTHTGQTVQLAWEVSDWQDGVATMEGGPSSSTIMDSSKNWTPHQFVGSYPWVTFDTTTGYESKVSDNAPTTLMLQGLGKPAAAGDRYELVLGDRTAGAFVNLPGAYGPNPMVAGQWNVYKVPLTAFDAPGSPIAKQMIYKVQLRDVSGFANNVIYYGSIGYTKN